MADRVCRPGGVRCDVKDSQPIWCWPSSRCQAAAQRGARVRVLCCAGQAHVETVANPAAASQWRRLQTVVSSVTVGI
ncbi:MAG: hypothetical protein V4739_05835 [Pseudomonadota bacterium]